MVINIGCTTQLQPWMERDWCDVLTVLSKDALPLDRDDIQDLVAEMVNTLGLQTRFVNSRPGRDWVFGFERWWKDQFSRRGREGLSYQRATELTKHNIEVFYKLHESLEKKHMFKPENIWNADESGFQSCRTKQKVYCSKEFRHVYSLEGGNGKALYTVLFCVNAAGTYLPNFTIYKSCNLWYAWTLGGQPGDLYGCSPCVRMQDLTSRGGFVKIL